jgi:hypothetical protein
MATKQIRADEDRYDIPQRTAACRVCGWETWDDECWECFKSEGKPNKYGLRNVERGTERSGVQGEDER